MSASRGSDFISEARQANKAIWDNINKLISMQREWNALDYANELQDGVGANEGVTAAEVGAVVFDTADAFVTVLGAGHATNMAKLL
jgi:hypothetical protein